MASARKDFEGFLIWLHLPENEAPSNVRRLGNLILAKFDDILETSRQRNQRSVLLADLAQRHLSQTSDQLPVINTSSTSGTWPWRQLRNLTVGPFRGFRFPEAFDISKRIVLFYGPNGSGKTSLCEALEYALLGSVEEAEAKRINAQTYLSNIHENRFTAPVLIAEDHQGNEVNVSADQDTYRFCFIEKNRIDAFSRIAARPLAQRTDLISTLFGMDQFNDFVSHFNESIDSQITTTTPINELLTEKHSVLVHDKAVIKNQAESLAALESEELELALSYSDRITYQELKILIGGSGAPSRIQILNDMLNYVPPPIIGVTRTDIFESYEKCNALQAELKIISATLNQKATQVSFRDLFVAVIALHPTEGDHCPACDTPLQGSNHTINNPYQKAEKGLKELEELANLQEMQHVLIDELNNCNREFKLKREACIKYFETISDTKLVDENQSIEIILNFADQIEAQDNASRLAQSERQRNIEERDKLVEFQLLIQAQEQKRNNFLESIEQASKRIQDFDLENSELIAQAKQEILDHRRDAPIKEAYDQFLALLRLYRNRLPGSLMAGLNDTAMQLYNEFNRGDIDSDKLDSLHLPITGEHVIEICFRGNPNVKVDALRVLSEGHIRCLGLSIILAKSMSIESPLIVFDDAINAIDHDHRRGIRETIFESEHFANTQIIITCHSHEFIKDIQQSLPVAMREDSSLCVFKHHSGNYQPRVNSNVASRNYVEIARRSRDEMNDRGALDASRKAIEMLAYKIWRWLISHGHGIISLPLAGPTVEPSLRNLCEALRKKIASEQAFVHANKPHILVVLDTILGIPEQNLIWVYLNKGTHEEADRDDFDSACVESIVTMIETLDALDLRPNR